MPHDERSSQLQRFEIDAEVLVADQLDLIAQLERQLRAVHRTMRQIEKLRSVKSRVGRELTNGEKMSTLGHLTDELTAIDEELKTQHECCVEMKATVDQMRARIRAVRQQPARPEGDAPESGQARG